jgi:hypothetical protein
MLVFKLNILTTVCYSKSIEPIKSVTLNYVYVIGSIRLNVVFCFDCPFFIYSPF